MVWRKQFDWEKMQAAIDSGAGYNRCHQDFGIAHATWAKAIRLGSIRVDPSSKTNLGARKRYNWSAIQRYYDDGNSYRRCMEEFGFTPAAWAKAVRKGKLRARARRLSLEDLYAKQRCRHTVKRVLLEAGILCNVCDECGLGEWRGKPLSIQIDHVNGKRDDHRIENLRMLCPNCHSQTDTYGGRNNRRKTENKIEWSGVA